MGPKNIKSQTKKNDAPCQESHVSKGNRNGDEKVKRSDPEMHWSTALMTYFQFFIYVIVSILFVSTVLLQDVCVVLQLFYI